MRNVLKWWPVILLALGLSTWAAGEYVDDRIDSKLSVVIEKLHSIETVLARMDQRLKHIEESPRR